MNSAALDPCCGSRMFPYRRRMSADGPRYKALGNSMAVNVMEWIGGRIQMVEEMPGPPAVTRGRQHDRFCHP